MMRTAEWLVERLVIVGDGVINFVGMSYVEWRRFESDALGGVVVLYWRG